MLLIICHADADRYAIDSQRVDEVLPRVVLSRPPQSPSWFAGLLIHRGTTAPVMDLNGLVAGRPCPSRLSNRIVMLQIELDAAPRRLGILAESVALRELPAGLAAGSDTGAGYGALGRFLLDDEGLLHLIEVPQLVTAERRPVLFPTLERAG